MLWLLHIFFAYPPLKPKEEMTYHIKYVFPKKKC